MTHGFTNLSKKCSESASDVFTNAKAAEAAQRFRSPFSAEEYSIRLVEADI